MSARRDLRSSAQQLPVRTTEQLKASLRKSEHESETSRPLRSSEPDVNGLTKSEREAAEILDAAFSAAKLRNPEIAALCNVSESMVIKWRSQDARGCPSFLQLLLLPPAFHFALHKVLNRKFGFGKLALRDCLESLGSLAMVIE